MCARLAQQTPVQASPGAHADAERHRAFIRRPGVSIRYMIHTHDDDDVQCPTQQGRVASALSRAQLGHDALWQAKPSLMAASLGQPWQRRVLALAFACPRASFLAAWSRGSPSGGRGPNRPLTQQRPTLHALVPYVLQHLNTQVGTHTSPFVNAVAPNPGSLGQPHLHPPQNSPLPRTHT